MVGDKRVSAIMQKHLEAIDEQKDRMIKSGFNHISIHNFRESIRQFRALIYFYMPNIRPSDYRVIENISKKYFNMTSLIREIDVFENGYSDSMTEATKEKIGLIKEPLLQNLKDELAETRGFLFQNVKLHVKAFEKEPEKGPCFVSRQCELLSLFIDREEEQFGEEKYIHNKRMMAKKILYIHEMLLSDRKDLNEVNLELESFQEKAKQVHDVCVNLRFIGKYRLDDEVLITKLVRDHVLFTGQAAGQYDVTCDVIKSYLKI